MVTYSGWQLKAKVGTSLNSVTGSSITGLLDAVQRITVNYDNSLERKEATGQRTSYAIVEGQIKVSGNIERFWTGSGADRWATGAGGTGSLTEYYIGIYPNGAVAGQPYIAVSQAKFGDQEENHRPGSQLMTVSTSFEAIRTYSGSLS